MVTVSSHNPFRVQPLSPGATGNSINPPPSFHTVAGDDETILNPLTGTVPDLPSIPEAADLERDLPPLPAEDRGRNRPRQPSPPPVITLEPPPPAYTATPDIHRGESTLDVGPRRPFQQSRSTRSTASSTPPAQGPALAPSYTGPSSSSNFLTPSLTGFPPAQRRRNGQRSGLIQQIAGSLVDQLQNVAFGPDSSAAQSSQGPRSAPRHARSFSSFTSSPGPSTSPPPLPLRQTPSAPRLSPDPTGSRDRSPASASSTISRSTTSTTARSTASAPVSDFARDFYAAGTADGLLRVDSDLSSDDHHHSRSRSRDIIDDEMPSSPQRSIPRRRNSFDASQFATSSLAPQLQSQPSTSSPSSPTRATLDDSKPTSKPVPGHPLLRGGKLLVYPKGYTCSKCFNVGYKRGDPNKHCKKCWAKFGKPYVPALLYAPSANATTTLQRPLPSPSLSPSFAAQSPPQSPPNLPPPMTRAPSAPSARQQTQARPSASNSSSSNSGTCQNNNFVRSHRYSPSEPPYMPSRPPVGPSVVVGGLGSPVPAGAPVYQAGDRRLGGVRCWMCGGTGTVSYFIFDSSQCETCKGVGRWYM